MKATCVLVGGREIDGDVLAGPVSQIGGVTLPSMMT